MRLMITEHRLIKIKKWSKSLRKVSPKKLSQSFALNELSKVFGYRDYKEMNRSIRSTSDAELSEQGKDLSFLNEQLKASLFVYFELNKEDANSWATKLITPNFFFKKQSSILSVSFEEPPEQKLKKIIMLDECHSFTGSIFKKKERDILVDILRNLDNPCYDWYVDAGSNSVVTFDSLKKNTFNALEELNIEFFHNDFNNVSAELKLDFENRFTQNILPRSRVDIETFINDSPRLIVHGFEIEEIQNDFFVIVNYKLHGFLPVKYRHIDSAKERLKSLMLGEFKSSRENMSKQESQAASESLFGHRNVEFVNGSVDYISCVSTFQLRTTTKTPNQYKIEIPVSAKVRVNSIANSSLPSHLKHSSFKDCERYLRNYKSMVTLGIAELIQGKAINHLTGIISKELSHIMDDSERLKIDVYCDDYDEKWFINKLPELYSSELNIYQLRYLAVLYAERCDDEGLRCVTEAEFLGFGIFMAGKEHFNEIDGLVFNDDMEDLLHIITYHSLKSLGAPSIPYAAIATELLRYVRIIDDYDADYRLLKQVTSEEEQMNKAIGVVAHGEPIGHYLDMIRMNRKFNAMSTSVSQDLEDMKA